MHKVTDLEVLCFGTPVVLIGSRNEDGGADLAPDVLGLVAGPLVSAGPGQQFRRTGDDDSPSRRTVARYPPVAASARVVAFLGPDRRGPRRPGLPPGRREVRSVELA
ncbi:MULTISPECIES: hypothetical protein [Kitasatospora]|uniref:Uncharacterized protein n=1 Tax=Kitasatospora cathayae TaxID=3004092 RepID=A0ABY7QE32_9ACTN|nr:hypothetical protein [Kitasatospora sp. HUAS 3-15]WBP91023.1 hypothetical protein O1G21_37585 [Kitasatospora sp. HUAS 3-15]